MLSALIFLLFQFGAIQLLFFYYVLNHLEKDAIGNKQLPSTFHENIPFYTISLWFQPFSFSYKNIAKLCNDSDSNVLFEVQSMNDSYLRIAITV